MNHRKILLLACVLALGCSSAPVRDTEEVSSEAKRPKRLYGFHVKDDNDGVVVDCVWKGWPADLAGLLPGDVVHSADALEVETVDDLLKLTGFHAEQKPHQSLILSVTRDSSPMTVSIGSARLGPPKKPAENICLASETPPESLGQAPADASTQSIEKQVKAIQKQVEEVSENAVTESPVPPEAKGSKISPKNRSKKQPEKTKSEKSPAISTQTVSGQSLSTQTVSGQSSSTQTVSETSISTQTFNLDEIP